MTHPAAARVGFRGASLTPIFQSGEPYVFDDNLGRRSLRFGVKNESTKTARNVRVQLVGIIPDFVVGMARSPTAFQADFPYWAPRVTGDGSGVGPRDIGAKDEELFLILHRRFGTGLSDLRLEGFDTKEEKHVLLRDQGARDWEEPWEWQFVYRVTCDNAVGKVARFQIKADYGVTNCELVSVTRLGNRTLADLHGGD